MRNIMIIYIVFACLIFITIISFVQFRKGVNNFKIDLEEFELVQKATYEKANSNKLANISENHKVYEEYKNIYDEDLSITQRDTTYSFFPFRSTLKYTHYSISYIQCLHDFILNKKKNNLIQEEVSKRESSLQLLYGTAFSYWYDALGGDMLIDSIVDSGCSTFFPGMYRLRIKENAWAEFESFLEQYTEDRLHLGKNQENALERFDSNRNAALRRLNSDSREFFLRRIDLEKQNILETKDVKITYTSANLGNLNYVLEETVYSDDVFQRVLDEALREQWKNNRLPHGAMPYANCFGRVNSCSGMACSRIDVKSGGSDVLVLIKDTHGNTVRHGYIRAGRTMNFHVPNGRYQVFFNYGSGWNPDKIIEGAGCDNLRGGFVENVRFTKDNYETLRNHILTYELISQVGGNFAERTSSQSEFFN